jgi:hypothetical protein
VSKKPEHYLITLELIGPYRMHGYVMTTEQVICEQVADEMAGIAEAQNLRSLGIVLVTGPLDKRAVAFVRKLLAKECGDDAVSKALAEATDFHRSIWMMDRAHPEDQPLMKLH